MITRKAYIYNRNNFIAKQRAEEQRLRNHAVLIRARY